jgi:hypothetical protein
MVVEGHEPFYYPVSSLDNMRVYSMMFPMVGKRTPEDIFKKVADVINAVADAEVAYGIVTFGTNVIVVTLLPSSKDALWMWNSGLLKPANRCAIYPFVMGYSEEELDYKQKVICEIAQELGGFVPGFLLNPYVQRAVKEFFSPIIIRNDRSGAIFKPATFGTSMGAQGAADMVTKQGVIGWRLKQSSINKGLMLDDYGDGAFVMSFEGNLFTYLEEIFNFDPADPEAVKGAEGYFEESTLEAIKNYHLTPPCMAPFLGKEFMASFSPQMLDFGKWQGRVKTAFDPNGVADDSFYAYTEEE